jgi:hypothetical protein
MRGTPFMRIAGIYGLALLCVLLWPIGTRPMPHAAKSLLASMCRMLQVDYVLASPLHHGTKGRDSSDMPVQEHQTIEKSFAMTGAHRSIEIDNVFGSVEVTGGTSDQVQLTVEKSLRAESQQDLELAKKEVTLDITQENGALKLYVNGPFRCHCDDDCHGRRRDGDGYVVKMDFKVRVPRDIDTKVKTVNEGHVTVNNVAGTFLVRNVNGDISMRNVAGSGSANTVNGPVRVTFRENPKDNSSFGTINGNVELSFVPGLSADFRFKTMNGGVYSDFPVTALPTHALQEDHRGGKTIFRADRYTGARVNAGGPEIKIENLNGDIRILENHE